jgi:SAM-dependent methyltransferase
VSAGASATDGLYADSADLYDLAFDWGFEDEVEWLVERFGPGTETVLELACGSGRYFPHLLEYGIWPIGIDLSETMIERARHRLEVEGYPEVPLVAADMTDFEIDGRVDAAFCSVNSLGYLPSFGAAASHLAAVARALRPGAPYLIQQGMYDPDDVADDFGPQTWETEVEDGTALDFTWELVELDLDAGRTVHRSTVEVTAGPRAGEIATQDHHLLAWTWETWSELTAGSPFQIAAVYDGDAEGRPPVENEEMLRKGNPLFWHELRVP